MNSNLPLLVRLPELDTVLRILLGDSTVIRRLLMPPAEEAEMDWTRLCLALMLFVHPPPLSRLDLVHLVEEASGGAGYANQLHILTIGEFSSSS